MPAIPMFEVMVKFFTASVSEPGSSSYLTGASELESLKLNPATAAGP